LITSDFDGQTIAFPRNIPTVILNAIVIIWKPKVIPEIMSFKNKNSTPRTPILPGTRTSIPDKVGVIAGFLKNRAYKLAKK
jgi:hypothetical protein